MLEWAIIGFTATGVIATVATAIAEVRRRTFAKPDSLRMTLTDEHGDQQVITVRGISAGDFESTLAAWKWLADHLFLVEESRYLAESFDLRADFEDEEGPPPPGEDLWSDIGDELSSAS